ncbi:MAG: hypothetical protein ACRC8S_22800 [Fimbriiglobus sp.]
MSRFLALDPDAGGLFLATASLKKGSLTMEQTIGLPAQPEDGPLVAATAVSYGQRLAKLLEQAEIKPAPVYVILGRDRVIIKEVKYPACAPVDEPLIVRGQATKELVDAIDDVVMDYIPMPDASDGMKQAQVVFVRKDLLLAVRTMCETAGLKIAGITPRPFALTGVLPASLAQETSAVASLWEGGGEFVISRNGQMMFARNFSPQSTDNDATLASELKRNLAVYAGQRNALPVQGVYLTESHRSGAAQRAGTALSLPAETFDPLAGIESANVIPSSIRGRFAAPVGLLKLHAANRLPINFTVPRQPKAEATQVSGKWLLAGVLAIALLFGLGVVGYLMVDEAESRLAGLKTVKSTQETELAKYDTDIKRLTILDEYEARNVVWLDELYELAARMPEVDQSKITMIDAMALAPPKVVSRPGQPAVDPKKVPPAPVASLKVTVRTPELKVAQALADSYKNDKYYPGTNKTVINQADGSRGQQYDISMQILHRTAKDYLRQLNLKYPTRRVDPSTASETPPVQAELDLEAPKS